MIQKAQLHKTCKASKPYSHNTVRSNTPQSAVTTPTCAPPCCLPPIGRHGLLPLLRGPRRRRRAGVAEEAPRDPGGLCGRRPLLQRRQEAAWRRGRDDGGRARAGLREDVRQRSERRGVPPHAAGAEGHEPGRHGRVGGELVTAASCLVIRSGGRWVLSPDQWRCSVRVRSWSPNGRLCVLLSHGLERRNDCVYSCKIEVFLSYWWYWVMAWFGWVPVRGIFWFRILY